MALLYHSRFLFTGDHLWWDPHNEQLGTPSNFIWDKTQLLQSLSRLSEVTFEWVLPGHGHRVHFDGITMQRHLKALVESRSLAS